MAYYVDVFSLETFEEFSKTDLSRCGFNPTRKSYVSKIKPGDKIICYLKGLSCWVGLLEVTGPMQEETFAGSAALTLYTLQFPVKPVVWLKRGQLVRIRWPEVWSALSFTKDIAPGAGGWNYAVRSSGNRLKASDGEVLEAILKTQAVKPRPDLVTDEEWAKGKSIQPPPDGSDPVTRVSHLMQAKLADIGATMGFQVWLPKADKDSVAAHMDRKDALIAALPVAQFSDEVTLKTVEQIDVLWLNKKTIVRAFEVEHTTAVYSGILRMADLLALQPNFYTKLHIVAPMERRKKVFQELRRPAFSVYEQGPMVELCTYIPYERISELASNPFLEHMKDGVLDELEEGADEGPADVAAV